MADPSNSAAAAAAPSNSGAQPDPLIGRTVNDRFKILSVIARGGMGKVYKAEQAPLGRICAVKVLNPNYNGENDPEFHKRFFLEASIASKLSHPNTVTIFDYGKTDDDIYYMAMEYLEGRTLHRVIRNEGPLPASRVLKITMQICRSLREAHALGVIHRDLKPANIFMVQNDEDQDFVKVLDFGLVKNVDDDKSENLTQTGLFMGSPKYMAPEQIRGDKCTPATDVYALGVVMFEMLTGKVPYDGGTSVNTLMMHVNDAIPNMREVAPMAVIPEAVEQLTYRCMQKRPADRYATMDELIAAIKRASGETPDIGVSMLVSSGEMRAAAAGDPSVRGVLLNPSGPGGLVSGVIASVPPEATVAEVQPGDAPQKKSRGGLLYALLGLALVAGVAGGLVFFKRAQASAARSTPSTTQAGLGHETVPPPASTVHVSLQSDPSGAEVFEGDRSLGRTPLTLDWTGEQGDPTRSHSFSFRLAGHHDATVSLTGARLEHTAHLDPAADTAGNSATAAQADAGAAQAGANPPGTTTTRPHTRTNRPRPTTPGTPTGYRGIDDW